MRGLTLLFLAALAMGPHPVSAQPAPRLLGLTAEGGDFRADLSDGTHLRGAQLVGAVLRFEGAALRIDSARRDTETPLPGGGVAQDVWLFGMSVRAEGAEEWAPYCGVDPQGERLAMPYPAADGSLRLTCSAGAIGKCIRFGYRPWASLPDGRSLAPFHATCSNLVRAAYGEPERGWTRDGMRIDIYDRVGIQYPSNDPTDSFEAGWTPAGAVCLAHTRVPENGGVAEVVAAHPRLAAMAGPERCTEASAAGQGALLFNRSPRR
jgi:hypothetical protein